MVEIVIEKIGELSKVVVKESGKEVFSANMSSTELKTESVGEIKIVELKGQRNASI